jgi:hypothetical protein
MVIREIRGEDSVSTGVKHSSGEGFALLSGKVILGELGEDCDATCRGAIANEVHSRDVQSMHALLLSLLLILSFCEYGAKVCFVA